MAIRTKLTTKGFEAYLEKIAQAGQDIDAIAAEALQAGGEVLLAGLMRRVPRDSGNLAENLGVSAPQRDGNFTFIEVGLKKSADGKTHRYALAQEYGWASHTGAKAGQPYLRPTLDEDMASARAEMRRVLQERGAI